MLADGTRVPFLFVPRKQTADPPTFYIMEDKVWNGLFALFAAAEPSSIKKDGWELGGQVEQDGIKKDLKNTNGRLPVFRVTVEEAQRFARWFARDNGKLPSTREWDKAGGRFEANPGLGPCQRLLLRQGAVPANGADKVRLDEETLKLARIGIRRSTAGPMSLDEQTLDVSPFGCRHMSGNGLEWTRTLEKGARDLPPNPAPDDPVVLRGRDYKENLPFLWKELEGPPEAAEYGKAAPDTGFRIVIELE